MLFFGDDILKNPSASGGIAPKPLPGALPLDPTGGLLRPPDPYIIFLLFHFSPVPCLSLLVVIFAIYWLHGGWHCLNYFLCALRSADDDKSLCLVDLQYAAKTCGFVKVYISS